MVRTIFKILLYVIFSFLGIFIVIILASQISPVQQFVAEKVSDYLEKKLETRVDIGKIRIEFPSTVSLYDIYLEDKQEDTLWYSRKIIADLAIVPLMNKEIRLISFLMEGVNSQIKLNGPDSSYNFNFIIQAFSDTVAKADTAKKSEWDFSVRSLRLNGMKVHYRDLIHKSEMRLVLGELEVKINLMDFPKKKIEAEKILLSNTFFYLAGEETAKKSKTDTVVFDWVIRANDIELNNNQFGFSNFSFPRQKTGIDFNHMSLSQINSRMKNIQVDPQKLMGDIEELAFQEQSGFRLKHFTTSFYLDSVQAELRNMELATSESYLSHYAKIRYASFSSLIKDPSKFFITVDLENSVIAMNDILYFQPQLLENPFIRKNRTQSFILNTKIDGTLDKLHLDPLSISLLDSTEFVVTGYVNGLPDTKEIMVDIHLEKFISTKTDLETLLPSQYLPSALEIPAYISINAEVKGSFEKLKAAIDVNSSLGIINANAEVSINNETYQGNLVLDDFLAGQLLKQPDLGSLSLTSQIKGLGFNVDSLKASLSININHFGYMNYAYKYMVIKGDINQKKFDGDVSIKDKNVNLDFKGLIGFEDSIPTLNFLLSLEADLQALHFAKEDLRVKGTVKAELAGNNLDNMNGIVDIRNTTFVRKNKVYPIDSFLVATINQQRWTEININSDLLSAHFKGTMHLSSLFSTVQNHLNSYFEFSSKPLGQKDLDQNFDFKVQVFNTDLLTEVFVPSLEQFKPGIFQGSYSSADKRFSLEIDLPEAIYSNIALDSLQISVLSDEEGLNYDVSIQEIARDSLAVENIHFAGNIKNDSIFNRFSMLDEKGELKFLVGSSLVKQDASYRLAIMPGQLMSDYQDWEVNPSNHILFSKNVFYARDFTLSNGEKMFSLNSMEEIEQESSEEIILKNLSLDFINKMLKDEQNIISGELNGNIILSHFSKAPFEFASNLSIRGLAYMGKMLGDISINADNALVSRNNISVSILGNENDIQVNGYYSPNEEAGSLAFDIDINKINLSTVEPFTAGQVHDLSGIATGKFSLRGTIKNPFVSGILNFHNTSLTVVYLNAYLAINDQSIYFDHHYIYFRQFTVKDSSGHTASFNGSVYTPDYRDYQLSLDLLTDKFKVLNTTPEDTASYYGDVIVSSTIGVHGSLSKPVINVNAKLVEGSNLTYVVEESSLTPGSEGIIEFIDMDTKDSEIISRIKDTSGYYMQGITLYSNVEIVPQVRLKVVLDEAANDFLEITGGGVLSFNIDPSGAMDLTGIYSVNDGFYQLSLYGAIKKIFKINSGTITWTGDPLNARIDIEAIYKVNTSPAPLVASQVSAMAENSTAYNRPLPFLVHLNLKGELLKPVVSFNITLPDEQRGALNGSVNAKLQMLNEEESELNKQVFALLVLNSFIPEDPLSAPGAGTEMALRNSASKILSQQLNMFSEQYIKGIDIEVGLESYYAEGGKTDLKLGLSKQFLDERLSVQIGSNIPVEGSEVNQTDVSDIAGDLSVEYKLTEDGRLRLKAFRETSYEEFIESELIETGLSFIYTKSYNKFRDLLQSMKNGKAKRKKGEI